MAAVRLHDDHGGADLHAIMQVANLSEAVVIRALRRLEGEYLETKLVKEGSGMVIFATVTDAHPAARRASGQWPDPDRIAQDVIAQLQGMADAALPAKGRTIRNFLDALTESGGSLFGIIVGQAIRTGTRAALTREAAAASRSSW